MNVKMAEALALAKIAGQSQVDQALGTAAVHGRFANKDLASILNAQARAPPGKTFFLEALRQQAVAPACGPPGSGSRTLGHAPTAPMTASPK
jgi:hypothetical protein